MPLPFNPTLQPTGELPTPETTQVDSRLGTTSPITGWLLAPRTIKSRVLGEVADHPAPDSRIPKFRFPIPEGYIQKAGEHKPVPRRALPIGAVIDLMTGRIRN